MILGMNGVVRKIFLVLMGIIITAILTGTLISTVVRANAGRSDFFALYHASRHAMETGRLADPDSLGYYPPSGRPILMLLSVLPNPHAAILWWTISVLLHGTCLYLVIIYLLPDRSRDSWVLAGLVVLAMTPWYVSDLACGNVSSLILASVVLSFFFFRRGRVWISAFCLGVGIAVKFLPVFLLFYYAIQRRWRAFGVGVLGSVLVGIIPGLLWFGVVDFGRSWKTWYRFACGQRTPEAMILKGEGASYGHQSLANVLLHTLSRVNAGTRARPFFINLADISRAAILKIWYAVVVLSALVWIYAVWPGRSGSPSLPMIHFALVGLPMVWFSPHVLSYYLTILLPAITILIWSAWEPPAFLQHHRSRTWIFIAIYWLLCACVTVPYARAYGCYLALVFVLAVHLVLMGRAMRRQDGKKYEIQADEPMSTKGLRDSI